MRLRIHGVISLRICKFHVFLFGGLAKLISPGLFNFAYNATSGPLDDKINAFAQEARSNFTAVSGFEEPELYVSYGHGDEDLTTLYSKDNLPRLLELKKKWDPTNVYRYNYPLIR